MNFEEWHEWQVAFKKWLLAWRVELYGKHGYIPEAAYHSYLNFAFANEWQVSWGAF